MNIVALDLSLSATGVATAAGTEVLATKLRGCERLAWIRDEVLHRVGLGSCDPCAAAAPFPAQRLPHAQSPPMADLVVIEDYAYSRSNQAHQIGELGGVIRLALHEAAIPYVLIGTNQLKKFATGKGNAGKPAMLEAAIRRLDFHGFDDNAVDARWLYEAAAQRYGLSDIRLPAAQSVALDAVVWPE